MDPPDDLNRSLRAAIIPKQRAACGGAQSQQHGQRRLCEDLIDEVMWSALHGLAHQKERFLDGWSTPVGWVSARRGLRAYGERVRDATPGA
jgi:hypothetical protein